ncbi:MAG: hypothetical protein ABS84_14990 [Rubrivivax sp. SCN 71-131]|nr:MAG: hypothetical protein ABS84_14990 [Rubrivivax sp. SCN 71-131]
MRIPAAQKARWVRESRAQGLRLTDWIIQRVERTMPVVPVIIPGELSFADLRLGRAADGSVSFDLAAIAQIERASGLHEGYFAERPEDAVAELITRWYSTHRAGGGAADPVAEDLLAEMRAEDARGGGLSYQPGRA